MLYTLTTNPAVDVNMTTDKIVARTVNRTEDLVFTPNGKGLNVSFALKHFGVSSVVMGFFGGFTGKYITAYCRNKGFPLVSVDIDETTRINFFVTTENDEYKFVNKGPFVSKENQNRLLNALENASDITCLTVNGSEANGQTDDFYDRVLKICARKKVSVILDISSAKLKSLLKYRPLLIKPNDEELKDIFGFYTQNEEQVITALKSLHKMGAQNVLLTLGERGSYFSNGEDIYFCETKKVKLKSSACAGDAFLAGFLSVWTIDPQDVEKALKRAAAAGANTAESNGLGDFAKVHEYEKSICVRKINRGKELCH